MAWIGGARPAAGCVFCSARDGSDDRASFVLLRGAHAFLILNAYPYAPGHLMAVTNRHVAAVGDARPEELTDAMTLVQRAVAALSVEYRAEGFNVGLNQGRVAGAGIEDHLHLHVVPRWGGDHNFATVVANTRVLPEELATTWQRLRSRVA
ncbi:MAG: HIT family hydrolase [Candidatus Rokuibacteriota bacterium]|nr:MAG: HIT family hydrolase [Candidatus Rokubacteria bacterium]PYO19827.1 MAG: HIT family hydrolase [Candidatus Rokubacteria bacterium]